MNNTKTMFKQAGRGGKLDTIVTNLESFFRTSSTRVPGWKLQWLNSMASRRADKFPKPPVA